MVMASRAKNSTTRHTMRLSPVDSCLVGCATANQLVSLSIGAALLGCLAGSCSELTAQMIRGLLRTVHVMRLLRSGLGRYPAASPGPQPPRRDGDAAARNVAVASCGGLVTDRGTRNLMMIWQVSIK